VYSSVYGALKLLTEGGRESRRHLEELDRTQWLVPADLAHEQLLGLQAIVRHAYEHVPFYRDLYRGLDIHPQDIRTLADFEALPTISKRDVVEHLEALVQPERRSRAQQIMTGASTGEPMRFYVDDSFWRWNVAHENRGRGWHGVREGDKMAWVWGAHRDMHTGSWRARSRATIMRHRYLDAFAMDEPSMRRFAYMLQRWRPPMIRAYASMIHVFAQYLAANRIEMNRPRLIEVTAEQLKPKQRELVEAVFGCPVTNVYTAREFATVAYGCEAGRSHINEATYLELLMNGAVVPAGGMGEVVITSLHQSLMPLIRYRLDDEAILDTDACPCGRGLPALKEIVGRKNDYIVTPDGKRVHDGFFAYYFWTKPQVARYQIHQADIGRLEIRIVCVEPVDRALLSSIDTELRDHLGPGIKIEPHVVDSIPLTAAGKHRFIVSELPPPPS
jgi:phenylacetate-CoA ligase